MEDNQHHLSWIFKQDPVLGTHFHCMSYPNDVILVVFYPSIYILDILCDILELTPNTLLKCGCMALGIQHCASGWGWKRWRNQCDNQQHLILVPISPSPSQNTHPGWHLMLVLLPCETLSTSHRPGSQISPIPHSVGRGVWDVLYHHCCYHHNHHQGDGGMSHKLLPLPHLCC